MKKIIHKDFYPFIEQAIKLWDVSSISINVVHKKEEESIHYGYQDNKKTIKTNSDSLYAIASITKSFTTMLLEMARETHGFDWNAPISSYMSDFKLYDEKATKIATALDLATHRSGLPRHEFSWLLHPTASKEELLNKIPYLTPTTPFRESWGYQNYMYLYLGHIVEHFYKKNWEDVIDEKIAKRFNLTSLTTSYDHFVNSPHTMVAYYRGGGRPVVYRNVEKRKPAGGIYMNSKDTIKWIRVLLGEDEDNSLKKELGHLSQPHMKLGKPKGISKAGRLSTDPDSSYGMGWFIETFNGQKVISHGGDIDGFKSILALVPELELGISVYVNTGNSAITTPIIQWLIESIQGKQNPTDSNLERYKSFYKDKLLTQSGHYRNKAYGDIVLKKDSNRIIINDVSYPIVSVKGEEYTIRVDSLQDDFTFTITPQGITSPLEPLCKEPILFEKV